jgi:hypothetical protein
MLARFASVRKEILRMRCHRFELAEQFGRLGR